MSVNLDEMTVPQLQALRKRLVEEQDQIEDGVDVIPQETASENLDDLSVEELQKLRRETLKQQIGIPTQRQTEGPPSFITGEDQTLSDAVQFLGRTALEILLSPGDIAQSVQSSSERVARSLGLNVPETSDFSGRDISSLIFGEPSEDVGFATDVLKGAVGGGLLGGPLGSVLGGGSVPAFEGLSSAIEESEQPEFLKATEQAGLSLLPFVGRSAPEPIPSTQGRINSLKSKINPLQDVEALEPGRLGEITPIEAQADLTSVPPEVLSENLPQPDTPPFNFIRDAQLDTITPNETTRGQLAERLSKINPEAERAAKRQTSQLYQTANAIAEGITFDAKPLVDEAIKLIKDKKNFKSIDRPPIRRALQNVLQDFGVSQSLISDINRLLLIDDFLEGQISASELPESLQLISEDLDAIQNERNQLVKNIPKKKQQGLSKTPVSNLIKAEQTLNDIIDFRPRDLRERAQPERRLNPFREKLRNSLDSVGDSNPNFDENLNLARESHKENVETFGRDFIKKLNRRESGTGVIANDLSNADAPNNIQAQLNILKRNKETLSLIPDFERTVVGEIFNKDTVNFNTRRIWEDVRNELSPQARQAGDNLLRAGQLNPIEQSTQLGIFNDPIMKQMETLRGLQNARQQLREAGQRIGSSDLVNLYEQQFTNEQLSKTFDPESLLIDRKKLGEFERNGNLRRSLDEINGRGFTEDFIETQRNILDIRDLMIEAQDNMQLSRNRTTNEFRNVQNDLSETFTRIQNDPTLTPEGRVEAFKNAWNDTTSMPLTEGTYLFTMAGKLGKILKGGNTAINLINAYRARRAGSPLIKRLKGQTNKLKKGKIGISGIRAAASTIDQGIKDIDRSDEDILEKATDQFIFETINPETQS